MIKKGEIRALVNPRNIKSKLKELNAGKISVSKGKDIYFDKELFKKGYSLRVRERNFFYPRKEEQYFLHLKIHGPDFRKMNVYNNWIIKINGTNVTRNLLKQLGCKEIFVVSWNSCEEFEVNGVKFELFYLKGWDWLIEIESVIKGLKKQVYNKLLETLALFDLYEKDLTPIEPAEYIFNKKFKFSL